MSRMSTRMRSGIGITLAAVVVAFSSVALSAEAGTPADATTTGHSSPATRTDLAPKVVHTKKGPTGYQVTFRVYEPSAKTVQLKGEWYFEDPSTLPHLADKPGNPVDTPAIPPSKWKVGDVPIQSPNTISPNWPVVNMKQVGHSGVWTYTTPLPSGVFSYGFYVDCTDPTQATCIEGSDPSNRPWNQTATTTIGSTEATSQIYVPSDPAFGTLDYSWQAPASKRGRLTHVTYPSPGHVTPENSNYLAVYTPPGYDARRAQQYPTLYLSHGGGGNEMDWSTQGDMRNILDNLIDTGQIQPMVVVMPNNGGYPASTYNAAYRADLSAHMIPYVEAHLNVSKSASQRAFSGLSGGGTLTNSILLNDTSLFGYYGVMSAGLQPGTTLTASQTSALKKKSIFIGGGWQEPIYANGFVLNGATQHTGLIAEINTLNGAGVRTTSDFINGGHEWYTWRILLKDFVTRVAFWPPTSTDQ